MDAQVYELMLLLKPGEEESGREKQIKIIEETVNSFKGRIKTKKSLGKKELAYPIGQNKEAYFYLLELEGSGNFAQNISKKIRLNEGILRYLITKKED